MQPSNDYIVSLVYQSLAGTLAGNDQQQLDEWLEASPKRQRWYKSLQDGAEMGMAIGKQSPTQLQALEDELYARIQLGIGVDGTRLAPVHRLHFLRRWWVAAVLVLVAIGSGVYFFNNQSYQSDKSSLITVQTKDVLPGGNKAIWTLADGKQIELDSTVLDMTSPPSPLQRIGVPNDIGYNELRTPRGGQYQLVLPDGSKVWLNAASSIKYPVVFNGNERKVDITGEAYFEIKKDVTKPFKVVGGGQEVEVLGTSFNINIYDDEPIKKTTLLTGKIRVSVGAALVAARNPDTIAVRTTTRVAPTITLRPGEQAQIINSSLLITNSPSDPISWKNGLFNFNGATLQEVMRQLKRWYDIEVVYEKGVPDARFWGEITRSISLNGLLIGLEKTDVHFRLEGSKLIVQP